MAIKNRIAKLEQRRSSLDNVDVKKLTDEQLYRILREQLSKDLGVDVSQYSDDEVLVECWRLDIIMETGQECRDWPHERVWDEWLKVTGTIS